MSSSDFVDIVCLSLEPWDEVWRRNQHMASELLQLRPSLRLLFVGNPVDVAWALRNGRMPPMFSSRRAVGTTGRLWTMSPYKWLPRRIWARGDSSLFAQVIRASRRLSFDQPVLWINDSTYAPLVRRTGWPAVYDVTDDWLLAKGAPREMERQRRNDAVLLRDAAEVVVCSPALAESRGRYRSVHLIPNGVDLASLRSPTHRPDDLPGGKIAMYQGTLSAGRLDIDLCLALTRSLAGRATLVFVGPNSLPADISNALTDAGAVILGPRPHTAMPAYLQHADVQVVPHQTTPFMESLDPLKAREYLAVGRPVVATPVAGFRDLDPPILAADRRTFVEAVLATLGRPPIPPGPAPLGREPETWSVQATKFLAVVDAASGGARQ